MAPRGAKSCVRRGQSSADLQPPTSSSRLFHFLVKVKVASLCVFKIGLKSYDCARSLLLHLPLTRSRLSFLALLLSDAATSGAYIKTVGRCRTQSKDQGYLFEYLLCSLFDLSFCLVKAALPLSLPLRSLLFSAPALLQHFKWHGVFN